MGYTYKDHLAAQEAYSKAVAYRQAAIRKNAGLRMSGKPAASTGAPPRKPKAWYAYTLGGDYMGWLPVNPWAPKSEAEEYLASSGLAGKVKLE